MCIGSLLAAAVAFVTITFAPPDYGDTYAESYSISVPDYSFLDAAFSYATPAEQLIGADGERSKRPEAQTAPEITPAHMKRIELAAAIADFRRLRFDLG